MFCAGTLPLGRAVILSLALAPLAFPVAAHEALPTAAKPNGWNYPFSCCSGFDCREVPATNISERPEGYVIGGTGEVVSYADKRIKDSQDDLPVRAAALLLRSCDIVHCTIRLLDRATCVSIALLN
jgi:hypothetical protein